MDTFSAIRASVAEKYELIIDEPFLVGIEVPIPEQGRRQSVFLAEIEDRQGERFLRIETIIASLDKFDAEKCLRLNLMLRVGYLAVGDLDGVAYIKMCENIGYGSLDESIMLDMITRIARMADEIENVLSAGADLS